MSTRIEAWAVTAAGHTVTWWCSATAEREAAAYRERGHEATVTRLIPATDLTRALDVLRELVEQDGIVGHMRALVAARTLLAEVDR